MIKQIEIFSPYDPNIQEILEGSRVEKRKYFAVGQEESNRFKFCQTELCNLNNLKEADFLIDLMYHCKKINGQIGKDPGLNYLYFKRYGTEEEFENAKKMLKCFSDMEKKIAKDLETQLENSPDAIKRIRQNFSFMGVDYWMEIKRN